MGIIKYIDRGSNNRKEEKVPGEGLLKWLYSSATGKIALHLIIKRKIVSPVGGWYMDSRMSAKRIEKFIAENNIDTSEFEVTDINKFRTFNDFFYRKLKRGVRPLGADIVSPADGKIVAFQSIKDVSAFYVKGTEFNLKTFLQNDHLAQKYDNGAMVIIRLAPADYHRYHFPASGIISGSVKIKGKYFSVSPLALRGSLRIFCENLREQSVLSTKKYGDILISDVGATMVGSIIQTYKVNSEVQKGDEKGYFAFGGSTLVLLFEKDKVVFDEDLIQNTQKGFETSIFMGEKIGE